MSGKRSACHPTRTLGGRSGCMWTGHSTCSMLRTSQTPSLPEHSLTAISLRSHALQLRQAKLAFPFVHLIVGVFSDSQLVQYGYPPTWPEVERVEMVRHCRWVDEVITDVPWEVSDTFLLQRRIDYIAIDEGTSVDPNCDKARVKGYDEIKRLGECPSLCATVDKPVDIYSRRQGDLHKENERTVSSPETPLFRSINWSPNSGLACCSKICRHVLEQWELSAPSQRPR